eukprot:14740094-Alexandrium_andersonii.AAC.1
MQFPHLGVDPETQKEFKCCGYLEELAMKKIVAWGVNDVFGRKNLLHPTKGAESRATLKGLYTMHLYKDGEDIENEFVDPAMRQRIKDMLALDLGPTDAEKGGAAQEAAEAVPPGASPSQASTAASSRAAASGPPAKRRRV